MRQWREEEFVDDKSAKRWRQSSWVDKALDIHPSSDQGKQKSDTSDTNNDYAMVSSQISIFRRMPIRKRNRGARVMGD